MTLENLAGFGWERPFLGVAMWFFMFGFAGLPCREATRDYATPSVVTTQITCPVATG